MIELDLALQRPLIEPFDKRLFLLGEVVVLVQHITHNYMRIYVLCQEHLQHEHALVDRLRPILILSHR